MPKVELDFTKFHEAVQAATPEALKRKGLTTKVMERLPTKPFIKQEMLEQELKRQDVKKHEREILEKAMSDIGNPQSISREVLGQAVADQLTPLEISMTDRYASYGRQSIHNVPKLMKTKGIQPLAGVQGTTGDPVYDRYGPKAAELWESSLKGMSQRTNIWQLPQAIKGASNHFDDPRYFSHSRSFDLGDGNKRTRHIMELQSDLAQRPRLKPEDKEAYELILKTEGENSNKLDGIRERFGTNNQTPEDTKVLEEMYSGYFGDDEIKHLHKVFNPDQLPNYDLPRAKYLSMMSSIEERMGIKVSEIQKRLSQPRMPKEVEGILPTWHERTLREENREASKIGLSKLRMAHPDTVAEIEAWPRFLEIDASKVIGPNDKDYGQTIRFQPTRPGDGDFILYNKQTEEWDYVEEIRENLHDDIQEYDPEIDSEEIEKAQQYIEDLDDLLGELGRFKPKGEIDKNQLKMSKEHQGIYDFYKRDVTKFVQKEFGAKEVTDDFGNKWYEWDVKPDARDNPIHYLGPAAAATGIGAAATHSDDSFANEISTLASIAGNRIPDERAALLRDPVQRMENFISGTPLPAAGKLAADLSPIGTVTTGLEAVQAADEGKYLKSLGLAGLTGLGLIPGVNAAAKGVKTAIDKLKKLKGK